MVPPERLIDSAITCFFFQAEDGIRDYKVTGVQTCALPILLEQVRAGDADARERLVVLIYDELRRLGRSLLRRERSDHTLQPTALVHEVVLRLLRSEERRVGKECRSRAVADRGEERKCDVVG